MVNVDGDFEVMRDVSDLCLRHWAVETMVLLAESPARFADIVDSLERRPSPQELTDALAHLGGMSLVREVTDHGDSRYELTRSGATLLPVLLDMYRALRRWRMKYGASLPAVRLDPGVEGQAGV